MLSLQTFSKFQKPVNKKQALQLNHRPDHLASPTFLFIKIKVTF